MHYEQYRTQKASLKPDHVKGWEADLIAEGQLLPPQQGKRSKPADNPFAKSLAKYVLENPGVLKVASEIETYETDETELHQTPIGTSQAKKKTVLPKSSSEETSTNHKKNRKSG